MLTLYHNDMSVCAAKVRTALAEKKLDWNGVHLDLAPAMRRNPNTSSLIQTRWSRRLWIMAG